jgi:hypothetical protein
MFPHPRFFAAYILKVLTTSINFPSCHFFFLGTLLPCLRASDKPIAIACFRLVTFFPLRPLFNVPAFFSFITFSTLALAPAEYFAIKKYFNDKKYTRSKFIPLKILWNKTHIQQNAQTPLQKEDNVTGGWRSLSGMWIRQNRRAV